MFIDMKGWHEIVFPFIGGGFLLVTIIFGVYHMIIQPKNIHTPKVFQATNAATSTMLISTILPHTVTDDQLIGNWKTAQDNGFEDEFDFTIATPTKSHMFSSYYHQEPAETGSWKIDGTTIILTTSGPDKLFTGVKIEKGVLHMIDSDGRAELYTKII
jgi:hypothetical protein